jgi:hypothetical protein
MVKFIMKVYRDFKQTMVPSDVWGAFRALVLNLDMRSEPYWFSFNDRKLRESAVFRELWFIDFPLDQLSIRRRVARFGWIK